MSEEYGGRDRLRELLDAVLDEDNHTLDDMAGDAYSSPFHFSRQLSRSAGEPPVAMKRRVMLERAAWQLRQGASVTDTAFEAGYESVEGFSRAFTRAFGHAPSASAKASGSHWLPAPNGIHFHPPTSLWVHAKEQSMNPVTEQLVAHDLDDTRALLETAKQLSDEDYRSPRLPGNTVLGFDGPDESVAHVLTHLVFTKEVWLAAIEGTDFPPERADDVDTLLDRHEDAAARWLATVRDIDRRGAWDDRLDRRPLRPARELRHEQRGRARAHVLGTPPPAGPSAAPGEWAEGRQRRPDQLAPRPAGRGCGGGGPVTRTTFYTATTLDGFIADEHDSLDWLFVQDQDEKGPLNYDEFIKDIGAIVMGATTYEWILAHLAKSGEGWPYAMPAWVVSHRELAGVEGADIRFAQGDVAPLHDELVAAADGKDVWVCGGGDLAAQFAEAGKLDQVICYIAPVTLGAGRPLFPRRFDFRLVEVHQNKAFMAARYDVVGPRT